MKFNSLKFEITALFTLIMGFVLIIFSGVFYVIIANTLYTELDNELKLKAQGVGHTVRAYMDAKGVNPDALKYALDKTISNRGSTQKKWWFIGFERRWYKQLEELKLAGDIINFSKADGSSIVHSEQADTRLLDILSSEVRNFKGTEAIFRTIDLDRKRLRAVTLPFRYQDQSAYFIQIVQSPKPITLLLQNWLHSIVISIPFILLLVVVIGLGLATRIITPLNRVTKLTKEITSEDLSERLDATYFHKEMNTLIENFNQMISRLEGSFQHIEEFSSHVAHELKTPLAIIRGEMELALMQNRTQEEYQQAMKVSLEETSKMLKIIEDLFLLTKISYKPEAFTFEKTNLNDFLRHIFDQFQTIAALKQIYVDLCLPKETFYVRADQVHLRRLFFNLLDNANKFTPEHGKIDIHVSKVTKKIMVSIKDSGIGIPKEDLPKVFERFFRINNQKIGSGLGLSIAQSIAKIHGGRIHVQSQVDQGTTFTVILPIMT